jgi:gliding motility-associated protein GldE
LDHPGPTGLLLTVTLEIFKTLSASDFATIATTSIGIAVLLFCSALVAGSENAFFSLTKQDIENYRNEESSRGKAIHHLLSHPKVLLGTILITNNFINIAFVLASEWLFSLVITEAVMLSTTFFIFQIVFVTFVIVFLAEVTPKIYATQNYLKFSRFIALPILFLSRLWSPFVWLLVKSTSIIDKRITRRGHELTMDDLEHAIDITSNEQSPEEEKEVLKNIVNFGNTDVKQIMKNRMDIKALEMGLTFKEVLASINEWEYSRLPVYEDNLDNVKGILNIKELLPHIQEETEFAWQELIKEPFYVPERKKIDDLLKEFQHKRVHMAVVVDEYGGCSGIVTMEDILEEIFGEIQDEFDEEDMSYSQLDEYTFLFEGKTLINDVCRLMDLRFDTFDEIKGETETLGGMLTEIAGKIPQTREKIVYNEFTFTAESVDRRRIKRVKIEMAKE